MGNAEYQKAKSTEVLALDYRYLVTILLYNISRLPPIILLQPRLYPDFVRQLPGSDYQQKRIFPVISNAPTANRSLEEILHALFVQASPCLLQ